MAKNHQRRVRPEAKERGVLENLKLQEKELKRLQDKNNQLVTNYRKLQDENRRHVRDKRAMQQKVTHMQATIVGHEKEKQQLYEMLKKTPYQTFHVSGNVALSTNSLSEKDICIKPAAPEQPVSAPQMFAAQIEKPAAVAADKPATDSKTVPHLVSFVERLKAILRKAATKNGLTIECRPKGHDSSYIYYINAECFCKAIDELASKDFELLLKFLGNDIHHLQLAKVCCFIGHTIRLNIINAPTLQITDMLFAFEEYYPNKNSVRSRLSDKSTEPELKLLLGIFAGLLKKHAA